MLYAPILSSLLPYGNNLLGFEICKQLFTDYFNHPATSEIDDHRTRELELELLRVRNENFGTSTIHVPRRPFQQSAATCSILA